MDFDIIIEYVIRIQRLILKSFAGILYLFYQRYLLCVVLAAINLCNCKSVLVII